MRATDQLLQSKTPFLTDGGLETWLFFQQGFEAPEFAAIMLMNDDAALNAMRRYFGKFLEMAEAADTGYILDTNTWRGCTRWAGQLDVSPEEMLSLSRKAVLFARELRDTWQDRVSPILVNGVVGPAGDGYTADDIPSAEQAYQFHLPQIETLVAGGVDMISAITITNVNEAIGIADAVTDMDMPTVVSFTVETDGRIPTGETLKDAIERTDQNTKVPPIYYMINCAHPDHFQGALKNDEDWVERIGGLRANASRMSHAELDNAVELDQGNPEEFGQLHVNMSKQLRNLVAVGGCCGTDHRHIASVSAHLHG